jgi:hypothetical protein
MAAAAALYVCCVCLRHVLRIKVVVRIWYM